MTAEAGTRRIWIAEIDGAAIGMLNMMVFRQMPQPGRAPSEWGCVANVYVASARREGGIGRALLDELLRYARTHRFVRLVLSPSPRSVPFYARAGFAPATELMSLDLSRE